VPAILDEFYARGERPEDYVWLVPKCSIGNRSAMRATPLRERAPNERVDRRPALA
jgi:hypothetical protein